MKKYENEYYIIIILCILYNKIIIEQIILFLEIAKLYFGYLDESVKIINDNGYIMMKDGKVIGMDTIIFNLKHNNVPFMSSINYNMQYKFVTSTIIEICTDYTRIYFIIFTLNVFFL